MLEKRLKQLRKRNGITQEQLAEIIGVERSSVGKYESPTKPVIPSQDVLSRIADYFSVSLDYLLGREPARDLDISGIPGILPLPKTKKVPRLGAIACGEPILATENIDEYDDVPEEMNCDFTLVCKGDSMIGARIMDGDIVYIRLQPEVEDGEIAAVLIDNEATLKRVRHGDGQLILWPENPAYAPVVYGGEQLECVRIIGKAVAFLGKVR